MVTLWPVEHASHARDLGSNPPGVKGASLFKKSQAAVSTTERHFTLSVVCLIVECTKDSISVNKKKTFRYLFGWKWIERSVLQLLHLKQKDVELLLLYIYSSQFWLCYFNFYTQPVLEHLHGQVSSISRS